MGLSIDDLDRSKIKHWKNIWRYRKADGNVDTIQYTPDETSIMNRELSFKRFWAKCTVKAGGMSFYHIYSEKKYKFYRLINILPYNQFWKMYEVIPEYLWTSIFKWRSLYKDLWSCVLNFKSYTVGLIFFLKCKINYSLNVVGFFSVQSQCWSQVKSHLFSHHPVESAANWISHQGTAESTVAEQGRLSGLDWNWPWLGEKGILILLTL